MEDWKQSLDRYLTSEPDYYGWDHYVESVVDALDEDFYNANQAWLDDPESIFSAWLIKLHDKDKSVSEAVKIIQRTTRLYKLDKQDGKQNNGMPLLGS